LWTTVFCDISYPRRGCRKKSLEKEAATQSIRKEFNVAEVQR
jgi:hypothetical protein